MFVVEDQGMQSSYREYPKEFMEGYAKAKAEPDTATVANSNPYDMASEWWKWRAWNDGFFNHALAGALEDFYKYIGEEVDHTNHIMVEETNE